MRLTAGTFSRLGASWDGRGTNFALFSANAEKVELCLFDNQGRRELERIELPERTEDVWHGYLNDVSPGPALRLSRARPLRARARPPLQSATSCCSIPMPSGLRGGWCGATRISPIAPAARARISPSTAATMRAACRRPSSSTRPSTGAAAKCVPSIPWEDTIIYEAHVKGLTQKREDVPPNLRGTYGGLSSPAMIAHLKQLGVTTIELLPIHAFVDDRILVEKKLVNYWGYNTLSFFAPEPRYAPGQSARCVPHHGGAAARCRHRGDARRRL